jgi:HD-like signal output (HDOD) protein
VVAVLAALGLVFLLKKSGKPAAKEPVRRQAATLPPKPAITPSATPQAAPQPALRTITRAANPHIEAMLKGFEFTRSADLSAEEAKAVVDMLVRIPRPPSALHKLVSPEFLASANTSELSEIVIAEPQIAAKVLVMVNSPFYGLKSPLGSIGQAVTFMGMNTVRSICLQYMLDECFQSNDPDIKKIFDGLWNASAFASELCYKLAQLMQLPEPGALVTQVVLSYLGHVASHSLLPKNLVIPMMSKGMLERARVEQRELGLSAAEIGTLLMREWELPQSIVENVRDIDSVLVTPCDMAQTRRSTNMAFCYVCARLGERLAYGEIKDLAAFDLNQDASVEFFHLHSYMRLPGLARLNDFLHMPEVVASTNAMVANMQYRK